MAEEIEEFDVIVVGGGPAGSTAAYFAAEEGANVALLDRKPRIGFPVRCGEGLPARVMEDFGIGLDKRWVCNIVEKLRVVSPKGRRIEIRPHMDACVLDRGYFDNMLARRAERKGAKLFLERAVVGLEDDLVRALSPRLDEAFRGRVIVGADGVDSRVGRWAGINTRLKTSEIGSCAQYRIKSRNIDPKVLEITFDVPQMRLGYGWVFPKGKNIANVGLGINPMKKKNASEILEKWLKHRFPDAEKLEFTVGCVPSVRPVEESVRGRVMLVGDAARQVMAATGAGVANAMIAGRIAGRIAGKVGTGGEPMAHLLRYDYLWRREIGDRLEQSHRMKMRFLRDKRRIETFFSLARVILGLYRFMPRSVQERIFANLHY